MFPDDLVLMACSKLRMATWSVGNLRGQLAMMASMIVSNVSVLGA
jgi:hypothetical protein